MSANPYGAAFGIGRRRQMAIGSATLRKNLLAVTDEQIRKAASEVFGKDRCAAAALLPKSRASDGGAPIFSLPRGE